MKVESGIPLFERYPFARMNVGDSFLIPPGKSRQTVSISAHRYGKKHGMKFVTRKTPEGYRCWRVE